MVFFLNTDEMQIETLFGDLVTQLEKLLSISGNKHNWSLSNLRQSNDNFRSLENQKMVETASHGSYVIRELESGTILVTNNGTTETVAKPSLRLIAKDLGIPILNSNGNPMNTRQLGAIIIKALNT